MSPSPGEPVLADVLRFRAREDLPEHPRYREGAIEDERRWIESLSDRELARLCASLGQVDRAVRDYRRKQEPPEKDAA